jgi:hypothetical protein
MALTHFSRPCGEFSANLKKNSLVVETSFGFFQFGGVVIMFYVMMLQYLCGNAQEAFLLAMRLIKCAKLLRQHGIFREKPL